jgi:hypothetical protein
MRHQALNLLSSAIHRSRRPQRVSNILIVYALLFVLPFAAAIDVQAYDWPQRVAQTETAYTAKAVYCNRSLRLVQRSAGGFGRTGDYPADGRRA